MNDQEWKDVWRAQKLEAPPAAETRAQVEAMRKRVSDLRGVLKARDIRELIAAALVSLVFSVYFFLFPNPVTRLGSLIVIGGLLFASFKLLECRRRTPRPEAVVPVAQWLRQEKERVHHEAELLRTVLWWYLLPILLGVNVFAWGLANRSIAGKIGYSLMTILLGVCIHWLNQRARRKQLLPVKDELEALELEWQAREGVLAPSPASLQDPAVVKARRRRNFLVAFLILLAVLVVWMIGAWYSRQEALRAPAIVDVSAFGERDNAQIDAWLREQVALVQYPGLSVAIVRDGRIVYQGAFGFEDIKANRSVTPQTSFHVASVTKVFTALIAATLHARGVIDLDQPVAKYLPNDALISTKPELGAKITLRQLASHTSGLPRGAPGPVQSVEGRYQLEPTLLYEQLARVDLASEPGTAELYSNLGFGLLGHALERAAGKPFDQLLQEVVCEPLHLERTATEAKDTFRVATGYSSQSPRRERTHSYRERFASSGGLIASVPDLAQFLSAHMKPGILSSDILSQLHTPTKLSNGAMARTGLGWTLRTNATAGRILEKNGGRANCSAWIGFAPSHGIGVAVAANCGGPDVDAIGRWLLERSVPGGRKPVTR